MFMSLAMSTTIYKGNTHKKMFMNQEILSYKKGNFKNSYNVENSSLNIAQTQEIRDYENEMKEIIFLNIEKQSRGEYN